MKAIDHEQSLETFEDIMSEDPILSYRFMIYTNSAALGLRTGIDPLRRGMVMMGYESIQRWLSTSCPTQHGAQHAAHPRVNGDACALTTLLLNPAWKTNCGAKFTSAHCCRKWMNCCASPWARSCAASRCRNGIYDATVLHTGPYAPSLQMACALENDDASVIRRLCEEHEMDLRRSTARFCGCCPIWKWNARPSPLRGCDPG